ncbi:hypothetical protein HYQ46_008345 [Verticillium longisporum]|nr:hypothetical protein HYQ46_008345 [Verticillium longisporum]
MLALVPGCVGAEDEIWSVSELSDVRARRVTAKDVSLPRGSDRMRKTWLEQPRHKHRCDLDVHGGFAHAIYTGAL